MTADESDTRDSSFEGLFRRFGRRPDRHQLTIRLLGPIEVRGRGGEVAYASLQEKALLVLLALHLNEPVPEDEIFQALWGDDVPATAGASCGSLVSGLRLLIAGSGKGLRIEAERSGYRMIGGKDAVDLAVVKDVVRQARKATAAKKWARAVSLLTTASAAWRGRALGDLADEPWAAPYSEELEELRLQVLELRFEAELACGRHIEVLPELQALTAAHPLREGFAAQLMLALFRCGRTRESLAVYRQLYTDLAHHLAAEPSPRLQRLHTQIASKDTTVEWKAEYGNFLIDPRAEGDHLTLPEGERVYNDPVTEQLRRVPALSTLSSRQLTRLARLIDVISVPSGQILTQQGKFGQQAFIVLEGSAEVIISGSLRRTVGPGEFVGEMAMIERQPRTATVIAKTPMRIGVIGPQSWGAFMDEPGVARAIATQLARRLRLADQMDSPIPSPDSSALD
jgi:DNA-binding SARP family transcriptional activator